MVIASLMLECACTSETSGPIDSPDHKHSVSVKTVLGGALSDDYVRVQLKTSHWWFSSQEVYAGVGNWNSKHGFAPYPTVEWRDNTHLLIKFADNELVPGGLTLTNRFCGNGDQHEIEVVCQNAAYPRTAHIRGTLSALEPCYVDQWTEFSFFNQRHRLNKEPSWFDVREAVASGKAVWIAREHSYRVINYRPAMPGVTLLEVTTKRACYIDTDRLVPETY